MLPVKDWRPEDGAGEEPLSPPQHLHHLQAEISSVVLTVDNDLVLVNRIDRRHGSVGLLLIHI